MKYSEQVVTKDLVEEVTLKLSHEKWTESSHGQSACVWAVCMCEGVYTCMHLLEEYSRVGTQHAKTLCQEALGIIMMWLD